MKSTREKFICVKSYKFHFSKIYNLVFCSNIIFLNKMSVKSGIVYLVFFERSALISTFKNNFSVGKMVTFTSISMPQGNIQNLKLYRLTKIEQNQGKLENLFRAFFPKFAQKIFAEIRKRNSQKFAYANICQK